MLSERSTYLFNRWIDQTLTSEELDEFSQLILMGNDEALQGLMREAWETTPATEMFYSSPESEALLTAVWSRANEGKVRQLRRYPAAKIIRWAAAAAILLLVTSILYYTTLRTTALPAQAVAASNAPPATERATLTLSNGSQLILDSNNIGELAVEAGVLISKDEKGRLIYRLPENTATQSSATVFNTMTTPRGGQFSVQLPDGTMVWLNASSSITYPASFDKSARERKILLSGEAYFEVAPAAHSPFRVLVNETTVEVLGTSFNINAYPEENVVGTTLLAGKVKITAGVFTQILSPGQQARATASDSHLTVINEVDTEEILAWKNGFFHFNNADIDKVMSEVSRWYDLDIIYDGPKPTQHYGGKIARSLFAKEMLQVLAESGLKFNIEGRKLIIKQ